MIRLESIYIKGFKDPEREVKIDFSKEKITVIYGENGSGKTTLLNILHAVFTQNRATLARENVEEIKITYEASNGGYGYSVKKEGKSKYKWDAFTHLAQSRSMLFGTN